MGFNIRGEPPGTTVTLLGPSQPHPRDDEQVTSALLNAGVLSPSSIPVRV